jgi:hypothetical protein
MSNTSKEVTNILNAIKQLDTNQNGGKVNRKIKKSKKSKKSMKGGDVQEGGAKKSKKSKKSKKNMTGGSMEDSMSTDSLC